MAVRTRHRTAARGLLAACGLHLLAGGALAQEAGTSPDLPADDAGPALRDGDTRLSDQRLLPPLGQSQTPRNRLTDPGRLDRSTTIRPDMRLGSTPIDAPLPPFDLRDETTESDDTVPNPGLSRRENRRDVRAEPAARAEEEGGTERPANPRREAEDAPETGVASLRAIGPVRSPTFDEIGGRRLADGLPELRRVGPGSDTSDPFAPVGTRIGSFLGYLTLDQSLGYSDNLTLSRDGRKGAFSQTSLTGRLISDWSRHEAELNLAATYRRNFAGPVEEEPRINADGRVRLDLTRDMTATLRGALSFGREDDFTAGAAQDAASRADILTYSFGGDLQARFGRFDTTASLQAVREDLSDRARARRSLDDSFTTYTAGLRAAFDERATLHPFVSASLGRRVFDQESPGGGSRDSLIPALRGGVGFNRGEKFSGEIAVGYAWNVPDEASLPTSASPTIDALLNWSPRRGTDLALRASTAFDPESSGLDTATLYQLSLELRHRATARLDLTAALVAGLRDRDRLANEYIYSGEAGFTYWLNRHLGFTGLYRYDRFEGAFAANSYDANTVRLGLRLQN